MVHQLLNHPLSQTLEAYPSRGLPRPDPPELDTPRSQILENTLAVTNTLCALILVIQTLALYKSFTYLLTYLLTYLHDESSNNQRQKGVYEPSHHLSVNVLLSVIFKSYKQCCIIQ